MANEAVLVYELSHPVPFTCSDSNAIAQGTLLKLADPMTVAAATADNDIFIGVAAQEKIANDGVTKIAVYLTGIFKMVDSGSGWTVGTDLVVKGTNTVGTYTTLDDEKGYKVGKGLETTSASETGLVLVGIQ